MLIGCWPPGLPIEAPAPGDLVSRLQAYMIKAIREAKRHTSWLTTNDEYESAMLAYVESTLRGPAAQKALAALRPLLERVARHGVTNSLAQKVLELTAPGVPDTYQGAEDWVFHLVDPDNRQPVAFDRLAFRLAGIVRRREAPSFGPADVTDWLHHWEDGDIKRHVTSALLAARREAPDVWVHGAYHPADVELAVDATAIAYARVAATGAWALTLAGLRTARLPAPWPVGPAWATSRVLLPEGAPGGVWRDLLSGVEIKTMESSTERWFFLAQALQALPVAVLVPSAS